MNRRFVTMLTGALVVSCMASVPASAGVVIQIAPPAFYIATTSPVYYQGHANYWYGNSWRYREGHTWRTYHVEPQYLHDYRGHHQTSHHDYGHWHDGDHHDRDRH